MRLDSRTVVLAGVFAALYVVVNVIQMVLVGNPTVYGPIQLRLADCLIPLAALLGWPVAIGVTIGCFLTNSYYFLGVQDVILGPIANMIAASLMILFRKRRFIACVTSSVPIGVIVGSYLALFFPPPDILSVLPASIAMIASITLSSLISIAGIGYVMLSIVGSKEVIDPLKSHGLRVLDETR